MTKVTKRPPIDGFILEAIVSEAEVLGAIVEHLNDPGSEWQFRFERVVSRAEVMAALVRLVRAGLVEVHVWTEEGWSEEACGEGVWPDRWVGELGFGVTGRGYVWCLNWEMY